MAAILKNNMAASLKALLAFRFMFFVPIDIKNMNIVIKMSFLGHSKLKLKFFKMIKWRPF